MGTVNRGWAHVITNTNQLTASRYNWCSSIPYIEDKLGCNNLGVGTIERGYFDLKG